MTISRPVMMSRIGDTKPEPLPASFEYDPAEPLAVSILFGVNSDAPVRWTFARELLVDGLRLKLAGPGDVTVFCLGGVVWIRLSSPDGGVLLVVSSAEVERFLTDTYSLVRPGSEVHTGLDAELMALLEEG